MRMAAGSGPSAYLNSVSARDVDLDDRASVTTRPVRVVDLHLGGGPRIGTSDYRVKVRVTATATTL